jgi:uncharacterized protein (TIGR03435 family)
MRQNLLAERFRLQVLYEDAMINGVNLVVNKGGSKLKHSGLRRHGDARLHASGHTSPAATTSI